MGLDDRDMARLWDMLDAARTAVAFTYQYNNEGFRVVMEAQAGAEGE